MKGRGRSSRDLFACGFLLQILLAEPALARQRSIIAKEIW